MIIVVCVIAQRYLLIRIFIYFFFFHSFHLSLSSSSSFDYLIYLIALELWQHDSNIKHDYLAMTHTKIAYHLNHFESFVSISIAANLFMPNHISMRRHLLLDSVFIYLISLKSHIIHFACDSFNKTKTNEISVWFHQNRKCLKNHSDIVDIVMH